MILHVDLIVRSMEASLDFYCSKLGFSVINDAMIRHPIVKHISGGDSDELRLTLVRVSPIGATIELVEYKTGPTTSNSPRPKLPALGSGWITIQVPDLDARIKFLGTRGLEPTSEIFTLTLPRGSTSKIVFFRDPDGNTLEFLELLKT